MIIFGYEIPKHSVKDYYVINELLHGEGITRGRFDSPFRHNPRIKNVVAALEIEGQAAILKKTGRYGYTAVHKLLLFELIILFMKEVSVRRIIENMPKYLLEEILDI